MIFSESLRKNTDFRRVYQNGKSAANHMLVLYIRKNGMTCNRIGISVSKKVGNSVCRHRIKRLVKESYRLNEKNFDRGLDLVVIARPGAREKKFSDMERALLQLSKKQGIWIISDVQR